jgi:hypothetical protein
VGEQSDKAEGLKDTISSVFSLRESAEKIGHNLATEIRTILFPPSKQACIAELSESMPGLTR